MVGMGSVFCGCGRTTVHREEGYDYGWNATFRGAPDLHQGCKGAVAATDERDARDFDGDRRLVLHGRAEDFLHEPPPTRAGRISRPLHVAPAVGPDRMRYAAEGDQ